MGMLLVLQPNFMTIHPLVVTDAAIHRATLLTRLIKKTTNTLCMFLKLCMSFGITTPHNISSGLSLISCTHSTKRLVKTCYFHFTIKSQWMFILRWKSDWRQSAHGLNDPCVMAFKCFIFVSALQSALLCNSSQLTNHRESRGHIETEAWVGVSPQAVWLHVGWNSLFSTDYGFVQ